MSKATWTAGGQGMPAGTDVWAYVVLFGEAEHVRLMRGRYDLVFDEFQEHGTDHLWTGKVLCWTAAKRKPSMTTEAIEAFVGGIAALVGGTWEECAHTAEDWLYREVLAEIVSDYQNGPWFAEAALKAAALKFTRHYS